MSMVVWVMMGIAIWHFTIFVPDRFWGGIVGAFPVAVVGAALFGFAVSGFTIPGAILALAASWFYGSSREDEHLPDVL